MIRRLTLLVLFVQLGSILLVLQKEEESNLVTNMRDQSVFHSSLELVYQNQYHVN